MRFNILGNNNNKDNKNFKIIINNKPMDSLIRKNEEYNQHLLNQKEVNTDTNQ